MKQQHEQLVADWHASGLTQKEFCFHRGITLGKFLYARRKEIHPDPFLPASKFSKVQVEEMTEEQEDVPLSIIFPSGARLEIGSLTFEQLRGLLQ